MTAPRPSSGGENPDTEDVLDLIHKAHAKVNALCKGTERWTMRIPADPSYDHDIIIGGALSAAAAEITRLRELHRVEAPDDLTARWLAWHNDEKQKARESMEAAPDASMTTVESIVYWWENHVRPGCELHRGGDAEARTRAWYARLDKVVGSVLEVAWDCSCEQDALTNGLYEELTRAYFARPIEVALAEEASPELERFGWRLHHGESCVECPDCGFLMGALHTDSLDAESYSCPNCEKASPKRASSEPRVSAEEASPVEAYTVHEIGQALWHAQERWSPSDPRSLHGLLVEELRTRILDPEEASPVGEPKVFGYWSVCEHGHITERKVVGRCRYIEPDLSACPGTIARHYPIHLGDAVPTPTEPETPEEG